MRRGSHEEEGRKGFSETDLIACVLEAKRGTTFNRVAAQV